MSATPREQRLTHGPVLPVLVTMALPNMLAMSAAAAVSIGETAYVGALGREALAAMAVVFPFVMLMQALSGGAIGGAISSAISRALGAGDVDGAHALAWHAALVCVGAGLGFALLFLLVGPLLYRLLGAHDAVLEQAIRYSAMLFVGAPAIWLCNALVSIVRGSGDMRTPSLAILATTVLQVTIGATLGLGLGPFPRWGMVGVALGQVLAFAFAALTLTAYLRSPQPRVRLLWRGIALRRAVFAPILRVGLLAALSPLQNILTILVITGLISRLGVDALAGYGIGARLEFLLIPIAFGVGVATVPMVGMAIGGGDVARARRVAWTGSVLAAALVGAIGAVVSVWPALWPSMFTSEPGVMGYAQLFMRFAGPGFAFYGLALALYFASQGAGRVLGVVLGATVRLGVIVLGGWWLTAAQAPAWSYFALVSAAMVAYGVFNAAAVWSSRWERSSALPAAPQLKTS
ncbi:MAG TPA: MATE family efflux transporter [Burkholderiaceae bacterium]|nr:MATE family efflux transporter [Burkholderiaceae bacterium]